MTQVAVETDVLLWDPFHGQIQKSLMHSSTECAKEKKEKKSKAADKKS